MKSGSNIDFVMDVKMMINEYKKSKNQQPLLIKGFYIQVYTLLSLAAHLFDGEIASEISFGSLYVIYGPNDTTENTVCW